MGMKCAECWHGAVAFASYERQERPLSPVRDRAGEKSPIWPKTRKGFVLESEARIPLGPGLIKPAADAQVMMDILFPWSVRQPCATAKEVSVLEDRSFLAVDMNRICSNIKCWWTTEALSQRHMAPANQQAGAAGELLIHDGTGLLLREGDDQHLAALLERLSSDYGLRMRLRQRAWQRLQALWHPRVVAGPLVKLCEGLLRDDPPAYAEGPCSKIGL
jgi:hypothetical protein